MFVVEMSERYDHDAFAQFADNTVKALWLIMQTQPATGRQPELGSRKLAAGHRHRPGIVSIILRATHFHVSIIILLFHIVSLRKVRPRP